MWNASFLCPGLPLPYSEFFSAYMKKLTSQLEERYKYRGVEQRAFQRSCVSVQKPSLTPLPSPLPVAGVPASSNPPRGARKQVSCCCQGLPLECWPFLLGNAGLRLSSRSLQAARFSSLRASLRCHCPSEPALPLPSPPPSSHFSALFHSPHLSLSETRFFVHNPSPSHMQQMLHESGVLLAAEPTTGAWYLAHSRCCRNPSTNETGLGLLVASHLGLHNF